MIGGFLAIVCSWGLLGLMLCLLYSVSDIPVLDFKAISGVDPAELT